MSEADHDMERGAPVDAPSPEASSPAPARPAQGSGAARPAHRPGAGRRLGELGRRRVDTSPRRLRRWVAVGLAVAIPSVLFGVFTASAEASLGPHVARYEVTVDHEITVDLGPLGSLVLDSPLPLTLGVRVVVREIPREFTTLGSPVTLDTLSRDLEQYVQLFSAPEATMDLALRALVVDAVRRSLAAAFLLGFGAWAVRTAMGPARRRELAAAVRPHRRTLLASTALVVLIGTTVTAGGTTLPRAEPEWPASAVFDGTPLEGARIIGRLAGVIDTYGGRVVDAYRDNERFYGDAIATLEREWAERAVNDAELRSIRELAGTATPPPDVEPVRLLVISDLHCNVGMARVVGATAELVEADVVLNAGDTTVNGTAVEGYCITALARALPQGVTTVVADGNHDGPDTAAEEASAGWVVLDGSTVEVEGMRILGDADPRATRIGVGTVLLGDETVTEAGERLRDVACADPGGVDLLLVHDPRMGAPALADGCVPTLVAGHYHRRVGPLREGPGVEYVSSSTAGALLGQPTVGPLRGVAEMTLLRFDPQERRILDYRVIQVRPDGEVSVGLAVRWPDRAAEPAQQRPLLRGPRPV